MVLRTFSEVVRKESALCKCVHGGAYVIRINTGTVRIDVITVPEKNNSTSKGRIV